MALTYDTRGNPILQYGAQDGAVSWLAERLNWWGYNPSMSDVYDWKTAEAVASMQRTYGLNPDGVMNEDTWTLVEQLIQGIDPRAVSDPAIGPLPGGGFSASPAGPGANGGPSGNSGLTPANKDALARLGQLLNQYGLGGMLDWVRSKLIGGASESEIQLEMFDQEAFKARFPVISQRQAAGLTPVSVSEVLEYEQRGREILRMAGLTSSAYTSSTYLQGLMAKDLSLNELNDRIQDGLVKVQAAPAEVRMAFGNYFGTTGDAAMAQLFLDPSIAVPELEKMATTAFAGGIGARFGIQLAQGIAREIADTNVSDAAIWQGFAQLDAIKNLFEETLAETTDLSAAKEGVQAVFNTGPGGAQSIQDRLQTRANQFKGSGGAGSSEKGVVGFGVADS